MPLTFELASFRVAPDNEATLVEERPAMVAALRRAFPGALGAWLTKQDDGGWLDIILWRSREEAEDAARRIEEVPEARAWFRHIAESQGLRHVEVVQGELFEERAS
jgi:Antibiotic biosynthesis monooxygenase